MRACIRCGTEIPDDAIYCQRCEHLVGTTASMPSPSSSPNFRPNGATDLKPQTRQRRRQRSFLASLLLLLGVRRNPQTGSLGCAFGQALSVALTAVLIIGFIAGPVLKLFPPFSPNSPSIQVTFVSAGSVNVHGANFPSRSRIHLILDGVGITFPPTSHPSISQSLYNISFYVVQANTTQQVEQPSFANNIIVREDGTFDAQVDIPKNWQPDSQHVIEAQAVGQDGRAQTQVQQTVTMPAESSGGVLSSPTPTPISTSTTTTSTTTTSTTTTPILVPGISKISPKSGPAGIPIIITGSGFTKAIGVSFGLAPVQCGVDNTCTVDSDTQITVVVPAENPSDASASVPVDVTVTTPNGTSTKSSVDQFTYTPLPVVSNISPMSGSVNGGTQVTIIGTGFTNATSVSFDSASILCGGHSTCVVNSDTQIIVASPAGSGTVDVTVTTPSGTSTKSSVDQFTYAPLPMVTSISPSGGSPTGGTPVTINGSGFTNATVSFGSTAATNVNVMSDSQITATSPAGNGTVDVTVTTPGGTSQTNGMDTFTYGVTPVPDPSPIVIGG